MGMQLAERMEFHDGAVSAGERGESYCPECGQSLDLSRHPPIPIRQRSLESYIFAILGLALVVVFGLGAWDTHRAMADIDQQIVDSWASIAQVVYGSPSDQEVVTARALNIFLTERLPIQRSFDRDLAGLVVGVGMTTIGVGTLIRRREELLILHAASHHGLLVSVTLKLWDVGESVARPLLWLVVMLGGALIASAVVRGEPLTLDLLDQTLTRITEIIVTITGMLS